MQHYFTNPFHSLILNISTYNIQLRSYILNVFSKILRSPKGSKTSSLQRIEYPLLKCLTILSMLLFFVFPREASARVPIDLWGRLNYSYLNDFDRHHFEIKQPDREGREHLKPPVREEKTHGLGIGIGATYHIDDFISLQLLFDTNYQFGKQESHQSFITSGSFGFRYTFDVFEYVPYAYINMGGASIQNIRDNYQAWDATASIGVGLNYRLNRSISIGVDVDYRIFLLHKPQSLYQITTGITSTWHF